MVGIIGSTLSSLISRVSGTQGTDTQSSSANLSPQDAENIAGQLRDQLEISDEALARLEDGEEALALARSIPSQLQQSSLEFDQARLGEIENRLDLLSSLGGSASDEFLDQLTDEVVEIARDTLAAFPNISLSNSEQSLQEFI